MPKKTASGKKTKKKVDAQWELFAKELRSMIPKLDSEGLAFLVEQGRIHLYNMQVDELNEAAMAAEKASSKTKALAGKPSASRAAKGGNFRIAGSETGHSFYLYYGNGDVMFSRDEMIRLVKMTNAPVSDMEIRENLYNWFDRERKDVFAVLPLTGRTDARLKTLADMIRKNYKIRK